MINYALTDLIDLEILQQLQDEFEKYTGLDAVVADVFAKPITNGESFEDVRDTLLEPSNEEKTEYKIKDVYLKKLLRGESVSRRKSPTIYRAVSPIMVEGEFIGLFICGTSEKENTEECKPEQVDKGAKFLSTIASALSRIAYENYIALNNSEVMQQSAKNQTEAITETALKLKKSMQEWASIINEALATDDLEIIKENLKKVLLKGNEVYNVVDYSVKEIQSKTETISLLETEYNLRHIVSQEILRVQKGAAKKAITFSYNIDGTVPHFLFGDTDRIMQIIFRLFKNSTERIQKGRVHMEFSCNDVSYSKVLLIKYTDLVQGFSESDIDAIQMFIATGDDSYLKKSGSVVYDYGIVNRLVRQLYGTIDFNVISDEQFEFLIKIPQLEIEVEELEG